MKNKPKPVNTDKLVKLINDGKFDKSMMINHLEMAVIDDYPILKKIKAETGAMMSGSGPTMFTLTPNISFRQNEILIIENLKTISNGVEIL